MTAETIIQSLASGLLMGLLYGLIAVGLALIFGLMDVVNFAHGVFYMVGAYLGFTTVALGGQFWLALLVVPIMVGLLGAALEVSTLRFIYQRSPSYQLLLTFGIGLVLEPDYDIIGISHDDHVASGFALSPALRPQIEDIVPVNIGQQW